MNLQGEWVCILKKYIVIQKQLGRKTKFVMITAFFIHYLPPSSYITSQRKWKRVTETFSLQTTEGSEIGLCSTRSLVKDCAKINCKTDRPFIKDTCFAFLQIMAL